MDDLAAAPAGPRVHSRAPRRVCLVIGQLGLGGAEKQFVLLAVGLRHHGVDVTVVVLTTEGPRTADLRAAGVPVLHLNMRNPGGWHSAPRMIATLGRLTLYLRRTRPDVVHAFLFSSYLMSAPAARMARVPLSVAGRRSLDDFKRGRRLALAAERLATRFTDHLVANAHAVADCVRATEQVRDSKLAVIYNGIPTLAFESTRPATVDTDLPVVLCVANLKLEKGHVHLLDAMALLRDRGLPCTLVLAGEGGLRAALRRQATELDLDVRLLGPRTDVEALLARTDVAVLPSLTEGMSNAVIEAMAAGRPVVATAVGGTPELLRAGRGWLTAPADPAGLADALAAVLRDPAGARRRASAAREWAWAHLTADVMVRRHIELYDALLRR